MSNSLRDNIGNGKISDNRLIISGRKFLANRSSTLFTIIIIFCTVLSLVHKTRFFNFSNFAAILLSTSAIGTVTFGMMILLISGVFDLSVGSIYGLGMVITAYFMKRLDLPVILSIILGLLVCSFCGLLNGFIISKMKINPLITTLATMGIFRGFAIIFGGAQIVSLPASFNIIGQKVVFGLQLPVWIMLFIGIVLGFCLIKIRFFRQFFFVGGNEKAAFLSGISINKIRMSGYLLMAVLAGIAGIVQCARQGAAVPTAGMGFELRAISAAVVGGASLSGGKGSIFGGLLGVFLMATILNAMVIGGISIYWQSIINSTILILAVYTDVISRKFSNEL